MISQIPLQIELITEITISPRILSEVDAALKAKQMKADVDEYLKVSITSLSAKDNSWFPTSSFTYFWKRSICTLLQFVFSCFYFYFSLFCLFTLFTLDFLAFALLNEIARSFPSYSFSLPFLLIFQIYFSGL